MKILSQVHNVLTSLLKKNSAPRGADNGGAIERNVRPTLRLRR